MLPIKRRRPLNAHTKHEKEYCATGMLSDQNDACQYLVPQARESGNNTMTERLGDSFSPPTHGTCRTPVAHSRVYGVSPKVINGRFTIMVRVCHILNQLWVLVTREQSARALKPEIFPVAGSCGVLGSEAPLSRSLYIGKATRTKQLRRAGA